MQTERVAGRLEDGAAVDDAKSRIHTQAQALEDGREVPGVYRLSIDGGLAAHSFEAGAVEERGLQRMALQRLVESGDCRRGMRERGTGARFGRSPWNGDAGKADETGIDLGAARTDWCVGHGQLQRSLWRHIDQSIC
ncbi:MAG: hypothetical protein ABS99_01990 [Acetobacteraceae bacterium SCN 69-10]|nr:MAG: hypothetical protein ABS99_01990 [Acetobacteraceae bacterium SCN 69-10]